MPLVHRQVTLGTATVEIVGHDNMPHEVHIHNNNTDQAHLVFVGGSAVTISNGLRIGGDETLTITLQPDDRLYGVSNHTATVVSILDIRKPE